MAIDSITQRQLSKFVFSGVIAVVVDFGVYYMANNYLGHNLSKGLSFLSGSVVAYLLNKFWTFEAKEFSGSQMFRFFFLYGMTLAINVFVNKFVLATIGNVLFGFLCATAASTILNFLGQKFWVFKK
ncbi:GtrA family protein [Muricauda sp. 2012CJ35-5]|uniref:GtrA family protein n=1 Tax=Flagellimonas spongiicola TaxID=2942208 RepID=A0ABT0PSE5_9FLAO|nr:GtrA family protein [Allomuricauda spongiicola]MCL6274284.1 GtrA family protein [Allomuricauda spongiicola]